MSVIYRTFNNAYIYNINENQYKCVVRHNAGFFSNCTICLIDLIESIKHLRKKNIELDTSNTFQLYKNIDKCDDLGIEYFKKANNGKEIDIISEKIESGIAISPYKNLTVLV